MLFYLFISRREIVPPKARETDRKRQSHGFQRPTRRCPCDQQIKYYRLEIETRQRLNITMAIPSDPNIKIK